MASSATVDCYINLFESDAVNAEFLLVACIVSTLNNSKSKNYILTIVSRKVILECRISVRIVLAAIHIDEP